MSLSSTLRHPCAKDEHGQYAESFRAQLQGFMAGLAARPSLEGYPSRTVRCRAWLFSATWLIPVHDAVPRSILIAPHARENFIAQNVTNMHRVRMLPLMCKLRMSMAYSEIRAVACLPKCIDKTQADPSHVLELSN